MKSTSRGRLSTGVGRLDRHLDGGVPAGSLVAYTAPAFAQGVVFLYELAAERETVYVSTTRNDQLVDETFEAIDIDAGDVRTAYAPPDVALEVVSEEVLSAGDRTNVIVDTADVLETYDRHRYQEFLNRLLIHLRNTGSIAVFHCHRDDDAPANRRLTQAMAELVLELHVTRETDEIETQFAVPKFRSGRALTEMVKVEITDRVDVDTSRNIG